MVHLYRVVFVPYYLEVILSLRTCLTIAGALLGIFFFRVNVTLTPLEPPNLSLYSLQLNLTPKKVSGSVKALIPKIVGKSFLVWHCECVVFFMPRPSGCAHTQNCFFRVRGKAPLLVTSLRKTMLCTFTVACIWCPKA